MPTIAESVARLTHGDTGQWRDAVLRSAELITSTTSQGPGAEPELRIAAGALLVYAIAQLRGLPPGGVTAEDVLTWLPSTAESVTELRGICQPLLVQGLQAAGHDVPEPGLRIMAQSPVGPVMAQWQRLTNWHDMEPISGDESIADDPGPNLGYCLSELRAVLGGERQPCVGS